MVVTILGIAVFTVAVALNTNLALSNNTQMDVVLADVEALARNESGLGSKCTASSNPEKNIGVCKKKVGGVGDECVEGSDGVKCNGSV